MYRRILVPLDGSRRADEALGQLSHLIGADTEVILLSVVGSESDDLSTSVLAPSAPNTNFVGVVPPIPERPDSGLDPDAHDRRRESAARHLDEKIAALDVDIKRRVVIVEDQDPARAIAAQATADGVDLILMTTHGRSAVARLVLGSVAESVLHLTHIPVLLVRTP